MPSCFLAARAGFNEAGGFLPRRTRAGCRTFGPAIPASMRPEDFSPGGRACTLVRAAQILYLLQ